VTRAPAPPPARSAPLSFLITALATQRLTRLLTRDQVTAPLREAVFARHPDSSRGLGYLVTCPHCISIHAAAAVLLLRTTPPGRALTTILAASAVTSLLSDYAATRPDPNPAARADFTTPTPD
jgi:Protein of unknown function (DUF1360)